MPKEDYTEKKEKNYNSPYNSPKVGIPYYNVKDPYYVTDPYKRRAYGGCDTCLEEVDKALETERIKLDKLREKLAKDQEKLEQAQKQLEKDKCEVQKERARLEALKKEIHEKKYKESDLAMMLDNP